MGERAKEKSRLKFWGIPSVCTVNIRGKEMFLAFRELKKYKTRYFLMSIIMVAVLFLVFFITSLANGLGFADSSALRGLKANYVIMNEDADGALVKSDLTSKQVDEINKELDGGGIPLTMTTSQISKKSEKKVDVAYFSVDTDIYPNMKIAEGKNINELNKNEVIVSESIKRDGIKLKDKIVDKRSNKEMIVAGFTTEQTYNFLPIVYADLNLGISNIYPNDTHYNAVLYNGTKSQVKGFDTFTKEETVELMPAYAETQRSFTMMKVALFVISILVSTVFFYVLTIQKLHQFGILKAIGANSGYIVKSIVIQVLLLTIIGLIFSSLLIYGMTFVLPDDTPFIVSPNIIFNTGAVFFILNLFSSLLSVYKAAKTDAIEAIGRVE